VPAYLLQIWFQFRSLYTILARQVPVQSSSSSRAHSNRVMDHAWCSRPSHCACAAPHTWVLCLIMFASSFLVSSVWQSMFSCTQNTQATIFPLWFNTVDWSCQTLDCLTGFILWCNVTSLCLFPFVRILQVWCYNMSVVLQHVCGATTNTLWCYNMFVVLQQTLCGATTNTSYKFYNVLDTQPSSRTFWLVVLSVTLWL